MSKQEVEFEKILEEIDGKVNRWLYVVRYTCPQCGRKDQIYTYVKGIEAVFCPACGREIPVKPEFPGFDFN